MNYDELKIRRAFSDKDWQEIKAHDTWQIFKIMSEFVDGFEKLSKIGPCVSSVQREQVRIITSIISRKKLLSS